MVLKLSRVVTVVAGSATFFVASTGWSAGPIGTVQFAAGDVKIRNAAGQLRPATKGATLEEGDTVLTAASASAQLKMSDGGILAVRPETELKIDTYRFAGKEDGTERAAMALAKGGFRTITGAIGRTNKSNYTVSTPSATIGIRGTDHEPVVLLPVPGGPPAGTYDKVNVGQAVIRTPVGEVNIRQNQVGFAAPGQAPTLLPRVPEFFKATPPVRQVQAAPKEAEQKPQAAAPAQSGQQQAAAGPAPADKPAEVAPPAAAAAGGAPPPGDAPPLSSAQGAGGSGPQSAGGPAPQSGPAGASPPPPTGDMRVVAVVDSRPPTASFGAVSPTTTLVAPPPIAPVVTNATTAVAPAPVVQQVTGTAADSSGVSLNLTQQTATTSSGTTAPIGSSTVVRTATALSTVSANLATIVLEQVSVSGGVQAVAAQSSSAQSSTAYTVDQNGGLLDAGTATVVRSTYGTSTRSTVAPKLLFRNGTVADVYTEGSGLAATGRQAGGTLEFSDGTTTTVDTLLSSAYWLYGIVPSSSTLPGGVGAITDVQKLVGTSTYSLAGSARPTDTVGNIGTLTTAAVTADFNSQTVNVSLGLRFSSGDSAARSTRDFELATTATRVPIVLAGFSAAAESSSAPRIVCSGTGCAPTSYQGSITGLFIASSAAATSTGSRLGLAYSFNPIPTATGPYGDLIQGTAVLSAATTPPVTGVTTSFATNANVRHEVFYGLAEIANATSYAVGQARDTISLTVPTAQTLTGPRANTNYLFDASNRLVRVFDTPYALYRSGVNIAATGTTYSTATPIANAELSFGGGGATAADVYDGSTLGIRFGRWQGGLVTVRDLATGSRYLEDLGTRSLQWIVNTPAVSLPVTGSFHYALAAATAPTDLYGNVGTLDRARLTVDFARNTVSAGVSITMPSGSLGSFGTQTLGAYFASAPITSGGFSVSSSATDNATGSDYLHLSCTGAGCAPGQTYGGRLRGAFTTGTGSANTAEGAYMRYGFTTNYADAALAASYSRVYGDVIEGYLAFSKGSAFGPGSLDVIGTTSAVVGATTVQPPGEATSVFAYGYYDYGQGGFVTKADNYSSRAGDYAVDANARFVNASNTFDGQDSLAVSGASTSTGARQTVTTAQGAFDLAYGIHSFALASGKENGVVFSGRNVDFLAWVRGPALYPFYLPAVVGNPVGAVNNLVTYTNTGGQAVGFSGTTATVNSASLGVNFNAMTVNVALNATSNGDVYSAVANGLRLDNFGAFEARSGGPVRGNFATGSGSLLTKNGNAAGVTGTLQGALMGPGGQAAGLVFDFLGMSSRATGAVVFGNPTYNNGSTTAVFDPGYLSDYRVTLAAAGYTNLGILTRTGGALLDERNLYRVELGFVGADRAQFVDSSTVSPVNPAGALVKIDAVYPFGYGCSSNTCTGSGELNARYAITDATGAGPLPANVSGLAAPTARVLEAGYDATTGIRWGRWGGGIMNVGDRASNSGAGAVPTFNGVGTSNQVDLTANNFHYVVTAPQSGPTVLPITGTASYTFVGGTSPTSFTTGQTSAVVGTLNSATLSANFTAKTVDVGVNLTMPGNTTWAASAANVPILKDTVFSAEKSLGGGGTLNVLKGGSATNTAGRIIGTFTGTSGQGAAIAYSLNQGGMNGTTVSGVAAFKKP